MVYCYFSRGSSKVSWLNFYWVANERSWLFLNTLTWRRSYILLRVEEVHTIRSCFLGVGTDRVQWFTGILWRFAWCSLWRFWVNSLFCLRSISPSRNYFKIRWLTIVGLGGSLSLSLVLIDLRWADRWINEVGARRLNHWFSGLCFLDVSLYNSIGWLSRWRHASISWIFGQQCVFGDSTVLLLWVNSVIVIGDVLGRWVIPFQVINDGLKSI
jgi:hypothetical protein